VKYHLVAFITVAIWGSTFVFTKMLLQAGLSPAQIFTFRFIIAYVLLLAYSIVNSPHKGEGGEGHFRWFCRSWRDEFLMVALGIAGGSLYFLTENAAMLFTTATNTSLIVCSCPLFAMLFFAMFFRQSEKITRLQALGSLIAFLGMAVVVLNGHFVLHLSPLGDLLAFGACLCWAVYSLLVKPALQHYSSLFITRKVFFYGLLTIIPYYILVSSEASIFTSPTTFHPSLSTIFNLLFLGVVASMLCYLVWNWVIGKLGPVIATNWVYFNPITTILFAWWLLGERITLWFLLGSAFILLGMYLADKRSS
jgi:drug/metabolite transporter (DMT)-like permease